MLRVADILSTLEKIAPEKWAFSFDKVGLQIGDPQSPVTRIAFSLDSSLAAAKFAHESRCQLLIAHHPLLFHPLDHLKPGSHVQDTTLELVRNNTAFIACHTNWDCAPGGVSDALAEALNLQGVTAFGNSVPQPSYKLVTFVPEGALQSLIDSLSEAGAGHIGNYERCAFFNEGNGTFLGNESSNPSVGRKGVIETVREIRLEMHVPAERFGAVKQALLQNHPYEEPAYDFLVLKESVGQPLSRKGKLPTPLSPVALQMHVDAKLGCRCQIWAPDSAGPIEKVAVSGGAAASEWRNAKSAGAQALVTGEVPQHIALEATEAGMTIVAAGHYHTEQPGVVTLAKTIRTLTGIDVIVFEPDLGQSGRPL